MATKPKKGKTSKDKKAVVTKDNNVSYEEIARQAYFLWLERDGDQLDNWLEAEQQLR
jgi:hypothetical protein